MKKQDYVAPTIVRHHLGQMNAQAHAQAPVCAAIDGVPIEELVAQHGSPVFVFSERTLRQAYRAANAAFSRRYPDVQFAWSYKTNYLKAVCAVFHQEGAMAEVVSDFEYEKARALGVPGSSIIFNGPYKQPAALERAIDEGARIQIDNLDELLALSELADRKDCPVDVAIRVHMDAGVRPVWSKFGFDADSIEAVQAIKRIHLSQRLRLVGLHTHVGTYITDPQVYARAASKLLDLVEIARRDFHCDIHYLNLGGGFASHSQLHYQYHSVETSVPTFDDYAEAICRPIIERWPRGERLPRLYLETGRALVDEAGYLITTIVALKQGSPAVSAEERDQALASRDKSDPLGSANAGGAAGYLVDSGIHLLYTCAWYRINVAPARPYSGPLSDRTIFGCLCMNIDVLRQSVALPNMNVGDRLVLYPVGAYNVSQSMQFITYRPRVVMIGQDGRVDVIRERENLEYVEAPERLPERLAFIAPHPDAPEVGGSPAQSRDPKSAAERR